MKQTSEIASKIRCPREQNFIEMYQQNSADQDRIRKLFPNNTHCKWLTESSSACDELPRDIAGVKKGCACPNNPVVKYQDILNEHAEKGVIIDEARRWESLIDLGLIPSIDKISAIQFCFASSVKRYMKVVEMSGAGIRLLG